MIPAPRPSNDRQIAKAPSSAADDETQRLRRELERMITYARALEQRCNRLWTYVPDTHGSRDPVVPFVARHCNLPDPGRDDVR